MSFVASRLRTCHLVVLVVDAEPLPQVSEHHGTVFFELKATRQVFSDGEETESHSQKHTEVVSENEEVDWLLASSGSARPMSRF